ncbi:unnamed protein product [Adineta steineri]|uniref:NmrA-like family domain-containing protein 1 n=2 Tax=Adineta steineri TaxID=433720 RepID=A0A819XBJ2_9BILA|nr:unnamed protein product [Adineta steineri]CAF0850874.1 unnamed protein product [Adineta steineri]CAF4138321.1 unnamed protein product [Adineta steineri]CAF4237390.1 unnamed protein product [Adineta steineri]
MTNKILITCATGKISNVLSPLLLKNGYKLRAFVHSQQSGKRLQETLGTQYVDEGTLEMFVGDLENKSDVKKALEGVDIVFHIGPSLHPREDSIGKIIIDESKNARVSHFILSSVLHPVRTKLLNHRIKIVVEEYLIESRLSYTILEPGHFMQNTQIKDIADKGLMNLMYSFDELQGYLDLVDYAEVTLNILQNPRHHNRATYELLGDNRTGREVAQLISQHSGKEIKCQLCQFEDLKDKIPMLKDANEYVQDGFARIMFYYNRWGLTGNNNILRFLLGREPTSVEDYIIKTLKA